MHFSIQFWTLTRIRIRNLEFRIRQKVPDPCGSGSTTLKFNRFRPEEGNQFQESHPFECVKQFENQFPGDFIFCYRDNKDDEEDEATRLKEEISAAYEKVASTAHLEGNIRHVLHYINLVIEYGTGIDQTENDVISN
jgi:hypothetical protein